MPSVALEVASRVSWSYRDDVSDANTSIGLEFKPSPFYTFEQQLGETKTCEGEQETIALITIYS